MSNKHVKKCSAPFRAGNKSLVNDLRPIQANTVIKANLVDKVDDLVRNDCHVKCIDGEGGCQRWNRIDSCLPQTALSESVRALGSEVTL